MGRKISTLAILTVLCLCSCKREVKEHQHKTDLSQQAEHKDNKHKRLSLSENVKKLKNPQDSKIFVVAHRGDWRNAPENSIQAIKNCIDMGVDVVEIDVQKTKDGKLIIMHDKTIDRTTTGKGKVSDWTLQELKKLYLRNGMGHPTHHKIPTLQEALLFAKGKIMLNLDKSYNYFNQAYNLAKRTGTVNQIIMKAYNKTYQQVREKAGKNLDSVAFMPIINLNVSQNSMGIIDDYQTNMNPVAFEMVFSKDSSRVLNKFEQIKKRGSRIWVNSLWKVLNAGHDDDSALSNTDSIYGWYVNKGINMIQTDRPKLLLDYLRKKGLHD